MTFEEDKLKKLVEFIQALEPQRIVPIRTEEQKRYIKYLRESWVFIDIEIVGDYEAIKKIKWQNLSKKT